MHLSVRSSRTGYARRARRSSATPRRARQATGNSAVRQRPSTSVLIVHGASNAAASIANAGAARADGDAAGGVTELRHDAERLQTRTGGHEPFGFHDGVAQPSIEGITGDGVPTGEFILGYPNHYEVMPTGAGRPAEIDQAARCCRRSPIRTTGHGAAARSRRERVVRRVPEAPAGRGRVLAVHEARSDPRRDRTDAAHMVWLASRWSGAGRAAPHWRWRRRDDPRLHDRNDFLYADDAGRVRLSARRARAAHQPSRRPQAVCRRGVAQHVRSAPAAAPGTRLRSAALRRSGLRIPAAQTYARRSRRRREPRAAFISSASTQASRASSSSCSRHGATTRASAG